MMQWHENCTGNYDVALALCSCSCLCYLVVYFSTGRRIVTLCGWEDVSSTVGCGHTLQTSNVHCLYNKDEHPGYYTEVGKSMAPFTFCICGWKCMFASKQLVHALLIKKTVTVVYRVEIERTDCCCSEIESVTAQICSGWNRTKPHTHICASRHGQPPTPPTAVAVGDVGGCPACVVGKLEGHCNGQVSDVTVVTQN